MLNAHLSFPLSAENPRSKYESALSVMEPVKDYLPGAYSDLIALQNWVKIQDGAYFMLWSSLDSPMVGFCELWPGYVSPAHRCFTGGSFRHDPQTEADYTKNGWIFSNLYNNNFGTNFSVSQTGISIFRYQLTSGEGLIDDASAVKWGWQAMSAPATIFTDRTGENGKFPSTGQFLVSDNPDVAVMNWKSAEDGGGCIARLWNVSNQKQKTALSFPGAVIISANLVNMVETDLPGEIKIKNNACVIGINKKEIVNIRLTFQ
jgi:hypothetical protein